MLQVGNDLLDVFKLLDTVLPEQVIDVPKISKDIMQQRLVGWDLRHTQTAEQLVEVPTILYFFKQRIPEQIVDNPVPRSRAQSVVQNADILVPGGSLQGLRRGQVSQPHLPLLTLQLVLMTRKRHSMGFFRTFPDFKKCEGHRSVPESSRKPAHPS